MSETSSEQTGENQETSVDKNEAEAQHAQFALEKGIQAGYFTQEDVEECFGIDPEEIMTNVASYIEMAGEDAETVMQEWGLVVDGEEGEV